MGRRDCEESKEGGGLWMDNWTERGVRVVLRVPLTVYAVYAACTRQIGPSSTPHTIPPPPPHLAAYEPSQHAHQLPIQGPGGGQIVPVSGASTHLSTVGNIATRPISIPISAIKSPLTQRQNKSTTPLPHHTMSHHARHR